MKEKSKKKALIFGITGQDGSYLADFLLQKQYDVHGVVRRTSTPPHEQPFNNIAHIRAKITLHNGDLDDETSIRHIMRTVCPDEVYNLAAQSDVHLSFSMPTYTANITGLGVVRILEAIRDTQQEKKKTIRFYQASSSELFGSSPPPQNEKTPFHPRSPYGCAKAFAHYATVNYREAYGIFACCGILFNHESPRRGENFVTRKITKGVARILAGKEKILRLGNLDAKRDWGYAPEYVEAMWLMLQQDKPDDFVIGTGQTHAVKDFLTYAFQHAGIKNWKKYVEIDPANYRPSEVRILVADAKKAQRVLGWKPKKTCANIAKIMLDADCLAIGQGL